MDDSTTRDSLLLAVLRDVPFDGWSGGMIAAGGRLGLDAAEGATLFPARARLAVLDPHREAVRRALALLTLPHNLPLSLKLLYDTVDAMWYAAGDTATDFNFYTKRGLLAGVYAATTLYWLDDRSPGAADTHAFLDRRLGDVMAIPRYGARLRESLARLPNPLRLLHPARRR